MSFTRRRLLAIAIGTTLLVAWLPVLVLRARGVAIQGAVGRGLLVFQSFAPLLGALVGEAIIAQQNGTKGIARSLGLTPDVNRFWLIAWVAPVLVAGFGIGLAWLVFDVEPVLTAADLLRNKRALVPAADLPRFDAATHESPMQSPFMLLVMAMPAGITLHLVPSLAAETGLRGFFFREMPGGFFARSLRIGLLEGVLAAPVVALGWGFPEHPAAGVALVVVGSVVYSMAAIYIRARGGSVVPVAIFHGTWLALARPAIDLTFGAADWQRPTQGVAGVIALAGLVALFAVHDRFFARAKLMATPVPATRAP